MQLRIFILEDNAERISLFKQTLHKKFPKAEIIIKETAKEAKEILTPNSYWDIILLDHDLGGEIYVDSNELNTGYQVALHIRDKEIKYGQCITHTQNPVGGRNITNLLGCQHIPFSELGVLIK